MNAGARILLIEDDRALALGLEFNLRSEGFQVVHCADGESGRQALERGEFDLVLLDWMLPGIDGIEVLKGLRARNLVTPVLLLTARDGKEDVVEGLEAGADDYLSKPFDLNILLARIRTLLRSRAWLLRKGGVREARFGDVRVDFQAMEARIEGKAVKLSYKEAMIMKLFWEKPGEVVTREELLQKVWGITGYVQSRTVDNFIVQLRKLFEKDPKNPKLIQSVHGSGYRFTPPPEAGA